MLSRATIGAAEAIEARRGTVLRIVFLIVERDEDVWNGCCCEADEMSCLAFSQNGGETSMYLYVLCPMAEPSRQISIIHINPPSSRHYQGGNVQSNLIAGLIVIVLNWHRSIGRLSTSWSFVRPVLIDRRLIDDARVESTSDRPIAWN
jgi:hypothetical protein